MTSLGAFDTSNFDSMPYGQFFYIIFILEVTILYIVLLNLIIALMGDSFNKVKDLGDLSNLRDLCIMISENEFILNREKEFANVKYLFIARLEKAVTIEDNLEKKIRELKKDLKNLIEQ